MRMITDGERALLNRRRRRVNYRVEVEDGTEVEDGVEPFHGLNDLFGREWVKSLKISEDIDQPSMVLELELQREWENISLNPLMQGSRANRAGFDVDAQYVPLLELDRLVKVFVSITPEEAFSENWMQVFRGRITSIDPSGATIKLTCRDYGHDLVTAWINEEELFDWIPAQGLPVVDLLDTLLSLANVPTTVYVPKDPGWNVKAYKQERMPVYEALQNVVMQFGWDLRYRFSVGNLSSLTLYEPPRQKTAIDFSFSQDDFYELSGMAATLDGVRNRIHVGFGPSGARKKVVVESAASIDKYRFARDMWIEESADSPLNLETEAARMALACLSDLAFPKFAMQATMPIFPWAQLGDVYDFTSNDYVFDHAMKFSVAGYTHDIKGGKATTTLRLRDGQPSGAYGRWLQREFRRGVKFL